MHESAIAASARLFWNEARTIALSRMALSRWLIPDPVGARHVPIVLIHGVLYNDGVW